MKAKLIITICMVFYLSMLTAATEEEIALLESHTKTDCYIFSYPRSGNTWVRYIIEYFTEVPTCQIPIPRTHLIDQPLAIIFNFPIDLQQSPILKVHNREGIKGLEQDDVVGVRLIMIIRNPKEAICRQEGRLVCQESITTSSAYYFDNIAVYDAWDPHYRFLMYYEDLLANPEPIIRELLTFLQVPTSGVDDFIQDIEMHKARTLSIYGDASITKGKDFEHYSKYMPDWYRKNIDTLIAQLYPMQWEKYLKSRYAEPII